VEKEDALDVIMIGLEKTTCIIARCAIYELLYLNRARTASADNLEKSIIKLYREILKFVVKAIAKSKGALPGESLMRVALTVPFPRGSLQSSSRD
jgi:hypothetical protein